MTIWLTQQAPVLLVALPLLAAPLAVISRNGRAAFCIVIAATWGSLLCTIITYITLITSETPVISYALGSWPPPWGIEYRFDRLTLIVALLTSGLAAIILPFARTSIELEIPSHLHYLFYSIFALCLTGLLGIATTGDAFNLFVFIEISSLSTYVLLALTNDRRALIASYRYLIVGSIGATFIVIGVGFLFLVSGTLNLADMAARLPAAPDQRPVLAGMAFLTTGVALKVALFPIHQWLPNAYTFSPSAVTAFLSGTATKVSVYVLMRLYFSIFSGRYALEDLPTGEVIALFSLAAMFYGSLVAAVQSDLKRLFAYSSIAQIGYITLGISFASEQGLTAAISHLWNHGITKAALFLFIGLIVYALSRQSAGLPLTSVAGLARRMPYTCMGIVLAGLSLIGIPGTAGFISKWYLISAALETHSYAIAAAIVLSSLVALIYVWRFVECAWFQVPVDDNCPRRLPLSLTLPTWLLALSTVWLGFDTTLTAKAARLAAVQLLSGNGF